MTSAEYMALVDGLGLGKVLGSAVYVHADALPALPESLRELVARVAAGRDGEAFGFNLVKLFRREFRLSLLDYPGFAKDPHPALRRSRTCDLATGQAKDFDYAASPNPPILHRKEAMLPAGHRDCKRFAALTAAEEALGLYAEPSLIGFRLAWERLLAEKGVSYRGHRVVVTVPGGTEGPGTGAPGLPGRPAGDSAGSDPGISPTPPAPKRHRTAIGRAQLSRPVQCAMEHGLLVRGKTVFDYGCGLGDDMNYLQQLGFQADGWDPAHCPENSKHPADVVNLGFVLNVIEDPVERVAALREAFNLAGETLVVAVIRPPTDGASRTWKPCGDGVMTGRETFQKYYTQDELRQFIEDALNCTAVAVDLGIFLVFRDPARCQEFLAQRSRRHIDWDRLSPRLTPKRHAGRREHLFAEHRALLDEFWRAVLDQGRPPAPGEFAREADLSAALGSPRRALRLLLQHYGAEALDEARRRCREDWLVYLAVANLRRPVPYRHLALALKADVKAFFGDYRKALAEATESLYFIGDPDVIQEECEATALGWQDEQALYVHRDLVGQLSVILRIYVGCAELLYGDLGQVDLVKLHKRSGKVTFLIYDDFERKRLPELVRRVKVNLRNQHVDVFEGEAGAEPEVLYFKHRYVSPEHPKFAAWRRFSRQMEREPEQERAEEAK
jgi:DNA phosphorothioation-associated putative methyltransferase